MNETQTQSAPRMGCSRPGFGPNGGSGPSFGPGACGPQGRFGRGSFGPRRVPVNIEETEDAFVLTLHAAGIQRDRLDISVKDDILTMHYQGEATETAEANKARHFTRLEAHNRAFERQFALKGKVVIDHITAHYIDGVLTVKLPKNPQTNQPVQKIKLQ